MMLHGAKDRKVPVSVKAMQNTRSMQEKSYKRVVIREARPGETSNPCVKEGHDAVRAKYFLMNSGDVSLTVEIQCWGGLGDDGHLLLMNEECDVRRRPSAEIKLLRLRRLWRSVWIIPNHPRHPTSHQSGISGRMQGSSIHSRSPGFSISISNRPAFGSLRQDRM